MSYNSITFCVFFALVYGLYWFLPLRLQNLLLLTASLVFYGWWDWRFLGLMALSLGVAHGAAVALDRREGRMRGLIMALGVATNLTILGFFKYYNFFSDSFASLVACFGMERLFPALSIVLPIGISFFTFQAIAYVVDVHRRLIRPANSLMEFFLFISYFPQLVAGPIVRAQDLIPLLRQPRHFRWERVVSGAGLALWGYVKKVVVADNLALLVQSVYESTEPVSGSAVLVATYAFAFQIYCDFSGYTDIARGISRMMDFELVLNFDRPYCASSIRDFWRRWHISLSTYLRDYLFIPLGGSRLGMFMTYRNLMLTMILGGLWHGAGWNYILWGLYQGLWLSWERFRQELGTLASRSLVRTAWDRFVLWHIICYGWLLFRANDLSQIKSLSLSLFLRFEPGGLWSHGMAAVALYGLPVLLVDIVEHRQPGFFARAPGPARVVLAVLMGYLLVTFGGFAKMDFIYFQF